MEGRFPHALSTFGSARARVFCLTFGALCLLLSLLAELEMPFGLDANDLNLTEYQQDYNSKLGAQARTRDACTHTRRTSLSCVRGARPAPDALNCPRVSPARFYALPPCALHPSHALCRVRCACCAASLLDQTIPELGYLERKQQPPMQSPLGCWLPRQAPPEPLGRSVSADDMNVRNLIGGASMRVSGASLHVEPEPLAVGLQRTSAALQSSGAATTSASPDEVAPWASPTYTPAPYSFGVPP